MAASKVSALQNDIKQSFQEVLGGIYGSQGDKQDSLERSEDHSSEQRQIVNDDDDSLSESEKPLF